MRERLRVILLFTYKLWRSSLFPQLGAQGINSSQVCQPSCNFVSLLLCLELSDGLKATSPAEPTVILGWSQQSATIVGMVTKSPNKDKLEEPFHLK